MESKAAAHKGPEGNAVVKADGQPAREMSLHELLQRPDWALLLPQTPLPEKIWDLGLEIYHITSDEYDLSGSCGCIDYDDSSIDSEDELICSDCAADRSATIASRLRPLLGAYQSEWGKIASVVADCRPASGADSSVLTRLFDGLCMHGSISAAEAAGLLDLHEKTVTQWGQSYELSGIPFLIKEGVTLRFGDLPSAISSLQITSIVDFYEHYKKLLQLIDTLGTLRILRLDGSRLWVSVARHPLDIAMAEKRLCNRGKDQLSPKELQGLAHAISRSNIEELSLRGGHINSFAHKVVSDRIMGNVISFLENLDSTALQCLTMSQIFPSSHSDAHAHALSVVAARFLRRSVRVEGYQHLAASLDACRIGAPNLRVFNIRQWRHDMSVVATALVGNGPQDAPEEHANAAAVSLPPNRTIVAIDLLKPDAPGAGGLTVSGASIEMDTAMRIFLPHIDVGQRSSKDPGDSAGGGRSAEEASPLQPSLVKEAQAQAQKFLANLQRVTAKGAKGALALANEQLRANSRTSFSREAAAFHLLKAARILACRVIGPQEATQASLWLGLPAEVRMLVFSACDTHHLLSRAQREAVIAFAADRRTIGFGRLNELLLFLRRLHLEGHSDDDTAGESQGQPVLDIVPVRWSWKASVQHALPADWPRQFKSDPFLKVREGPAAAFLAVTGCRTPRVDRDLSFDECWRPS